jgi:peptidoglycan/xylan/chitin deacetylase (PgdA/CDA1 family)
MSVLVCITVDVHPNDDPTSMLRCSDFFLTRSIPVTFLVSTAILQKSNSLSAIKALSSRSHDLGTHAHNHGVDEIRALNSGINDQLNFLEDSKSCFEDSLGYSPRYFRSPTWCGLGAPAVEELVRLGYQVDCSATPQRPGYLAVCPLRILGCSRPEDPTGYDEAYWRYRLQHSCCR